jgi:hypothetical protein
MDESMKVHLATMWYNEEYLAPFFLKHYEWVDKITIFIDDATTDKTEEIVNSSTLNIDKKFIHFNDGVDEFLKIKTLTDEYSNSDADYFIIVDSDELLFHKELLDTKEEIQRLNQDIIFVPYYDVYQAAEGESDTLDVNVPIYEQREYGFIANDLHIKPSIVKTGLNVSFSVGHHHIYIKGVKVEKRIDSFIGYHLAYFNLEFALERLLKNRKPRQSEFNIKNGINYHITNLTEEKIINNYKNGVKVCKKVLKLN